MIKSLPSNLAKNFSFLILFILISSNSLAFEKSLKDRQEYMHERQNSSLCNRYFPIYEHKYHMPSNMLRAISVTESGKWSKFSNKSVAWPWTINVNGKGYHFKSRTKAIAKVKEYMKKGKTSIDVGCMQINLKYHPDAFANLNQAFEPRYNIAYAAKFLNGKYKRNNSWETSIRHYHNIHKVHSDKYITRVYDVWRREDKAISLAQLERSAMYIKVTPRIKKNSSEVSDITRSTLETFLQ